ncbi:CHAT domain-containing protein [Tahibacter sp.]|uniref:CHAT domain-containing protein n=1 Tax=Tahibacter sp. TaxID=2056211 RepID=UPI0028C3D47E|nr:CHAT domain-containing protein [Tahibacter sp.]
MQAPSDENLLERLVAARPVDREALLAIEPRYGSPTFIAAIFEALVRDAQLLPVAHEVLRHGAQHEPSLLPLYARLALMLCQHASDAGDDDASLEILHQLEQCAHRHDDDDLLLSVHINRAQLAAISGDLAQAMQAGDDLVRSLARHMADGADAVLPPEPRSLAAAALGQIARRAYYERDDTAAAIRLAEASLRAEPDAGALNLAAIAHLRSGNAARARALFDELIASEGPTGALLLNLAQCLRQLDEPDAAIDALRQAFALSPDQGHYAVAAVLALCSADRLDEAVTLMQSAVPACEAQMRREAGRLVTTSFGKVPLGNLLAGAWTSIAATAIRCGRHEAAIAFVDDLLATREDNLAAPAAFLRSSALVAMKRPDEALRTLDTAIENDGTALELRLLRAATCLDGGMTERSLGDIAVVVRDGARALDALPLLERIVAVAPGHADASKWLGCALAYDPANLDRAISLLDEALARDPSDAYARCRRAVLRIMQGPDREPETRDVAEALVEISIAFAQAPDDGEIARTLRWVLDRVTADPAMFEWLFSVAIKPPFGIAFKLPQIWQAWRQQLEGEREGIERNYVRAVELLEGAQRMLDAADMPASANRLNLDIADSLIRQEKLQEAFDRISAYEENYLAIAQRPLTRRFEPDVDAMEARSTSVLRKPVVLELEFISVQLFALHRQRLKSAALLAECHRRTGNLAAALLLVATVEEALEALDGRDVLLLKIALNMIPLLRDANEIPRARRMAERISPHVQGNEAGGLALTLGTLLTREGDVDGAIAHYERILRDPVEGSARMRAEIAKRASLNLASLLLNRSQAERAWNLAEPYLDDPTHTPRDAIAFDVFASQAKRALQQSVVACDFARRAIGRIVAIREAMARADDRLSLIHDHENYLNTALKALLEADDAQGVMTVVETMRGSSLMEEIQARRSPASATLEPALARCARLARILDALVRLRRGIAQLGDDVVDSEALRDLQKDDPALSVLSEADMSKAAEAHDDVRSPPITLRADALDAQIKNTTDVLREAQAQVERIRFESHRRAPRLCGIEDIRDALRVASPGERCFFVSLVATHDELSLLFVSDHLASPRLCHTGMSPTLIEECAGTPRSAGAADALGALVAPIVAQTQPGDLLILSVPTRWSHLPFHATIVDGTPLNARNAIAYVPSATVLVHCLRLTPARSESIVVGDPLGDLPKARDEAHFVGDMLGVEPLLASWATVETLRRRLATAPPAHLHLACHGVSGNADDDRCALLLAPADATDDGILAARAIRDLSLTGTQAVLSACDSGTSGANTSLELGGLPRAFVVAGARCVVAALWKANDTAACLLMREFYRHLPHAGAARALARAQQWLRTQTAADIVAYCEQLLVASPAADSRARILLDRAMAEVSADDYAAAGLTLHRILSEADEPVAAPEIARARQMLILIVQRGDLPQAPDYRRQTFADAFNWAPFVLIGDWR